MKPLWLFYIGKKRTKFDRKTLATLVYTALLHIYNVIIQFLSFFNTAKEPAVPTRLAYCNVSEFETLAELENISTDVDAMRIQSLLICERVLGINHTDTLFRLMFR